MGIKIGEKCAETGGISSCKRVWTDCVDSCINNAPGF